MVATPSSEPDPRRTDLDDLEAARAGDQDACRRLLARNGGSMMKTAWRVLGRYGPNDADDAVQEAFVAALTTRAVPGRELGAWLRAITARKALDQLRRIARKKESPLPGPDEAPPERAVGGRPEAMLAVLTVRAALARLSAADRAILTLVDLDGFSMAEAARALGLTRVAVKLRAVRARRKLAHLIRGGGPGETGTASG